MFGFLFGEDAYGCPGCPTVSEAHLTETPTGQRKANVGAETDSTSNDMPRKLEGQL